MSAKYTSISFSSTRIAEVIAALNEKGLITTLYYQSATDLIFLSPICPKVIRITLASDAYYAYYGDAWTSGTTITNSIQFVGGGTVPTALHIICDTTYFVLYGSNTSNAGTFCYVGAMDNNDKIVMGMMYTTDGSTMLKTLCKNLTDGTQIAPLGFCHPFADASGKVLLYDLYMIGTSNYRLEMNGEVPAKVIGIKLASSAVSTILGTDNLRSGINMRTLSTDFIIPCNFYFPFTP